MHKHKLSLNSKASSKGAFEGRLYHCGAMNVISIPRLLQLQPQVVFFSSYVMKRTTDARQDLFENFGMFSFLFDRTAK